MLQHEHIDPKDPIGCRWIHGDTGPGNEWRYCQAEQKEGSDYCPDHHSRVYLSRLTKDGDCEAGGQDCAA
jgi:hypothetical protein